MLAAHIFFLIAITVPFLIFSCIHPNRSYHIWSRGKFSDNRTSPFCVCFCHHCCWTSYRCFNIFVCMTVDRSRHKHGVILW